MLFVFLKKNNAERLRTFKNSKKIPEMLGLRTYKNFTKMSEMFGIDGKYTVGRSKAKLEKTVNLSLIFHLRLYTTYLALEKIVNIYRYIYILYIYIYVGVK